MVSHTFKDYYQPREVKVGGPLVVLFDGARNLDIKAHHFHDMPNKDVMKFLKEFEYVVGRIPLSGN